jgi:hypothetical protein
MDAIKDPTIDVTTRFLADLRANTTRTAEPRDDPAWHAMALVAYELFGESAAQHVIMASRLASRSREEVASDLGEIDAAITAPCEAALRSTRP